MFVVTKSRKSRWPFLHVPFTRRAETLLEMLSDSLSHTSRGDASHNVSSWTTPHRPRVSYLAEVAVGDAEESNMRLLAAG